MSNVQALIFVAAIVVMVALLATPSLARDRGQYTGSSPELRAWFNRLSSGKGSCCSVADGRTIADADWISSGGHYRVRVPAAMPMTASWCGSMCPTRQSSPS
ncbi:hypothetical protein [Bradyrhizobium sp. Ec3.3]|uniref:hypothetical protein n=1 Tax=Bradyrhizobium sp. Ec3.3 TaxID=189753 RepID=UPI000688E4F2